MEKAEQINSVVNNLSDKIGEAVNAIAAKLGIAIEYVYPILRKQAMVDGILGILLLLVVAALIPICLKKAIYNFNKTECKGDYDPMDRYLFFGIIYTIVVLISVVFALIGIGNLKGYITALINPDWYIINTMLKQLVN